MSASRRRNGSTLKSMDAAMDKKAQLGEFSQSSVGPLTTNQGLQIPDNHNSLKAGMRGQIGRASCRERV